MKRKTKNSGWDNFKAFLWSLLTGLLDLGMDIGIDHWLSCKSFSIFVHLILVGPRRHTEIYQKELHRLRQCAQIKSQLSTPTPTKRPQLRYFEFPLDHHFNFLQFCWSFV